MNDRQFIVRAVICMSGNQSMEATWHSKLFFLFVFITQKLFLLYFSSAQINHLYDV